MEEQTTLNHPTSPHFVLSVTSPAIQDVDQALIDAINLQHAGHFAEAESLYRMILALPSEHAVASYGLGLLCTAQGRLQEAVDAYRHTIAIRPDFVDAYINLGTVVLALGRGEEAVSLYRRAILISPENAMAHGNLGKALHDLGRIDEAIAEYCTGIAHQPDNAVIHINFGAALLDRREWESAVTVTRRAIGLGSAAALAHANLGTALLHLGRYEEALAACRDAVALKPREGAILASLGGAMLELGALQEAEALCRQAILVAPGQPNAHFNLSHVLKGLNRLDEAEFAVRQAISLCPDSTEYHFHLAHILLLRGDFESGWTEYEWRFGLPEFAWIGELFGNSSRPFWAGEDISGKTILIFTEQGLGDIIQFARYLPLVVGMAERVIVGTHQSVRRLLETIDGIDVVPIQEAPLQRFDVLCPLLSLPRAFATRLDSIPAHVPYLRTDPIEQAIWKKRIDGDALHVGLIWAGNPATMRDRFRSPRLSSVTPLFSVQGVEFVALQVGTGRNDCAQTPLPPDVLDLGAEVTDLADTAAIMAGLDLVISSCTGPLHLAGALGVPTWAMIPFAPHFPWLLERTDTRWYPNMRLYRQEQPGKDWSAVVGRIAADLAALVQTRQKPNPTVTLTPAEATTVGDAPTLVNRHLPMTGDFNELARCRSGLMLYNRNDIYIGASLRRYGEFSRGEARLFQIVVQQNMTVLDIGANIGVHTIELSQLVGSWGVVHAFEPQRLLFQVLCANVALNSRANVYTHHAAVGAATGQMLVPFLDPNSPDNFGGMSISGARRGELVSVVTIDSLGLEACHVIKADVEGMEVEALTGAATTIGRFRPILYVENDREERSAELIGLVQGYGYRLYWHLPPIYSADNFRGDAENIFGDTISCNMLCLPKELPQESLTGLREVCEPTDHWYQH